MRVILQRVTSAKVEVDNNIIGEINKGFVVLLGIGKDDNQEDLDYLVNKMINLRVFSDSNDKFNLSLLDVKGELLIISQFTLFADTKKGNRPGFTDAADPEPAEKLYLEFVEKCKNLVGKVQTGKFRAYMQVSLINDGPVTIILDSKLNKAQPPNN